MKNEQMKQISAIDGWITMPPEEFHILVNKCGSCGDLSFPPDGLCRNPTCSKDAEVKTLPLNGKGKLVTYTINYYPAPAPFHPPKDFAPYGVCYVNMDEGLPIKGMVVQGYEKDLKVGMEMEAVIDTLYVDEEGNEVLFYKFKPAAK